MGERRRVFIDEDINPRIAAELRKRGRADAKAVQRTSYRGSKDPELLRAIAKEDPEAVLITGDYNMPATHAAVLDETNLTVAIVDPDRPPEYQDDEWDREVIHRWAHKIEVQPRGSVRVYSSAGSRQWRRRRRPGTFRRT